MLDKKGMTLAEIIIVVVLIGILSTIGVVGFRKTIVRARQREARAMVQLIQHAEEVRFIEQNAFIDCSGNDQCNTRLNLNLPASGSWTYNVPAGSIQNPPAVNSSAATFCAEAVGIAGGGLGGFHINRGEDDASDCDCSNGNCP